MIIVAISTELSIGRLLIGGLVPGIVVALVYSLLVYFMVKRNPSLAPSIPKAGFAERIHSLKHLWGFLLVVLVIIGGLYSGTFTATEAGAVGSFAIFLLFLLKEGFNFGKLRDALLQTIKTASTIFIIIASAFVFSSFLTITRIPARLSEFLVSLPVDPLIIMIGIIFMYVLIGMIMDMVPAMFITLPIIFPAVVKLGFDPVWFGVMVVFLAEMSLVTPPFGLSLFIVKATNPGSSLADIYRGCYPFIAADLVVIVLFLLFPQIITFLPSLM